MNKYNTDTGLKPYQGFIIAAVGIIVLIFIGGQLQLRLGSTGVILTEILMAAVAILGAVLFKGKLRRVFPIKMIKPREIGGIILMWIGTYTIAIIGTAILGMLFPGQIVESGESINNLLNSLNLWSSILVIAVLPAVCEEMLMRGAILSSFRSFKNKWYAIVLVGLIFGIYHLDPAKLFATAVLGMALSYIVLETDNMLLSMLYHFINNAFAVILSFIVFGDNMPSITENAAEISEAGGTAFSLGTIGLYLVLASVIPFALFIGSRLLKTREENEKLDEMIKESGRMNPVYKAAILTGIFFVSGIIIFVMSSSSTMALNSF